MMAEEKLAGAVAPAVVVQDFGFQYPRQGSADAREAVRGVSFQVEQGAFCVMTGSTGSGKTTLLRCMKPELAPVGARSGSLSVLGYELFGASGDGARGVGAGVAAERVAGDDRLVMSPLESAQSIGFVMQDPSAQIVCDTVWHELAFGLENIGMPQDQMRRRVAEVAHFFGIEPWIRSSTESLSGGQKQLVNLAAVLALRPRLLLLDEPTAQLDPNAVKQFVFLLSRVNRELGITVVMATHSPEDVEAHATQFVRLDNAVAAASREQAACVLAPRRVDRAARLAGGETAIGVRGLHYRFERKLPWVLRGIDLDIVQGSVHAIVGGNGCGKTTLLRCIAGVLKPQRGGMKNRLAGSQALLPQDPKALLVCDSVMEELMEWSGRCGYDHAQAMEAAHRFGLDELLDSHPYDLSGGQQQKLALAKLLLAKPRLLLLDEPTKGLDPCSSAGLSRIIRDLADQGTTIVLVTHDLDFAFVVADQISMLFDGEVACSEPAEEFLANNLVYCPNAKSRLFGAVVAEATEEEVATGGIARGVPHE